MEGRVGSREGRQLMEFFLFSAYFVPSLLLVIYLTSFPEVTVSLKLALGAMCLHFSNLFSFSSFPFLLLLSTPQSLTGIHRQISFLGHTHNMKKLLGQDRTVTQATAVMILNP